MKDLMFILRKEVLKENNYMEEYSCDIYDDAIKGLQRIREEAPKVLVIDLGMNKISGLDCLNIVRSNPKYHHTKIIATAKVYNQKLANEAFEAGADYFIKLPIDKEVIEKIASLQENQRKYFEI